MIYTELTKKALRLAYEAHTGQEDKAGIPYICHPLHLAEQMNDEISTCVALLHDVVEDTDWTLEAGRQPTLGKGEPVVQMSNTWPQQHNSIIERR